MDAEGNGEGEGHGNGKRDGDEGRHETWDATLAGLPPQGTTHPRKAFPTSALDPVTAPANEQGIWKETRQALQNQGCVFLVFPVFLSDVYPNPQLGHLPHSQR